MGDFGNFIGDYEVYELLGKGGFAHVYRAKVRRTGLEVAIKMIDKKQIKADRMENRVYQEISIHSRLKHPAVLELYTFFEDKNQIYLVLELCHNGELQNYLRTTKGTLTEDEARNILRQVVGGLMYLHSHHILHRDMKLANLLLTKEMAVKIGDFGLATKLSYPEEKHKTMCGTPNYISPEIASRASHGLETDVWGLGVMLYTVLVGKPPFDTDGINSILTHVVMKEIEFPSYLSPEVRDLMCSLLKKNPGDRIKLSKILDHPFMTRFPNIYSSSNRWTSHDSGVASSSCLTSKSYSYTNSVMPVSSGSLLPPRAQLTPVPRSSASNPPTFSDDQHMNINLLPPTSRGSLMKPSGMTSNYSSCSITSGHACPNSIKSGSNGWTAPDSSSNHGLRCAQPLGSGGVLPMEASGQRFYSASNPPSMAFQEGNCSHGWKCGQCSHIDTCGCLRNRTNGWGSTGCSHSNGNFSGCGSSHQQEPVKPMSFQQSDQPMPFQQSTQLGQQQHHSDSNNNNGIRCLRPDLQIPPLNSKRLEPIRQKTKHVILNILETGEVCLEFIKLKNRVEKVMEVLRISSDGLRIIIYYPHKGKGVNPGEEPPPLPQSGADSIYSYENIPEKHLKKYSYASRFVDLVKTKTAKVIYYSLKAKCLLMENGPDADFQATFYEGSKITKSGSQVKILEAGGWSNTIHISQEGNGLPSSIKLMLDHFKSCWDHCLNIEKTHESLSSLTEESVFPVTIGKRPACFRTALLSSNKENLSPISAVSIPNVGGYDGSVVSSRRGTSNKNRIMKQVQIPNIGNAMQLSNGVVCIEYPDGSKLFVEPSSSKISFSNSSGRFSHYQQNDIIPEEVRSKSTHIPKVVEALMSS